MGSAGRKRTKNKQGENQVHDRGPQIAKVRSTC